MRISDWSSDVCSSDLSHDPGLDRQRGAADDEREGGGDAAQRHAGPEGSIGKLAIAEQAQRLRNLHVDLLVASGTGYASYEIDRKSVVEGKGVSVRVDLWGCGILKKKNIPYYK